MSAAISARPAATLAKAGDLWLQALMLMSALCFASLCPLAQARLVVWSFLGGFLAASLYALGDSANCLYNMSNGDLHSWCVMRARHRGTAYAMLLPLAIGLLAAPPRPAWRKKIGFLETSMIFVMALVVYFSGSRSGMVGMVAGIVILAALAIWRGHAFALWRAILALCAAFGTYLATVRIMAPEFYGARLQVTNVEYGAIGGREAAWRAAVEIWQQNPVFGVGVWNFRYSVDHFTHPHNFILELMSDTGTLGAGLAAVLLVILAVKVLRMTAAGPASAGAAAAVAAFFTASLAATSIFYGWWLCVLFGILTVGVAANRVEAAGPETS